MHVQNQMDFTEQSHDPAKSSIVVSEYGTGENLTDWVVSDGEDTT